MSCVRCGRPACPDCLRSAAVGQQCVECIRQGNRTTRRPAGRFGGGLDLRRGVTWTLVAINVVCYVVELVDQNTIINDGVLVGRFRPARSARSAWPTGSGTGCITNAFLHEPPGCGTRHPAHPVQHVGADRGRAGAGAAAGPGPVPDRVPGQRAGRLGAVLPGRIRRATPALGASGAIFGLFGAWFVLARKLRLDARQIIGLIVINLVISFAVPGIAWQAHVGGLIAGAALTAAYVYAPRQNRALIQAAATVRDAGHPDRRGGRPGPAAGGRGPVLTRSGLRAGPGAGAARAPQLRGQCRVSATWWTARRRRPGSRSRRPGSSCPVALIGRLPPLT